MRTLLPILALLVLPAVGIGQDASQPAKGDAAKPPAAKPVEPAAAAQPPALPPKAGSHIPPDDNLCIQCHGDPDLWDAKTKRLYIARNGLAEDVHWKKGVNCSDCHGGNYKTTEVNEAHAKENGFRGAGEAARKMCAVCHENQGLELVKSVHAKAGPKDEQGRGTLLECRQCHGPNQHHILPVADSRSPVFVDHQVQTCGKCHEKELASYVQTVARPRLVPIGAAGDRHLRQLPRRPRHLSGGRPAVHALYGQRGRHLRQVPSLHRRTAASQRSRPGHGAGRNGRQAGPGRKVAAAAQLHLLPPGTRNRPGRIGAIPPATAQSLRQLPRRSVQPLCHDHPRRIDGVGLPAGGQLLRLPRLARHSGRRQSGLAASPPRTA